VAQKLGSPALLAQVRSAFAHGIDAMLWVSVGLAVAGVVLALLFLPWHATAATKAAGAKEVREGEDSAQDRAA
jgi:DHA2 family multidrug resistance protein-like MFS transporter